MGKATLHCRVREAIVPVVMAFPGMDYNRREVFLGALELCYHSMVASEPLLKLAASIPGPHQEYFIEHEKEERGHEEWMRKDIEAAGGKVGHPPEEIITMCGEMYYKVRHINPVALLGYMAVIEGFPQSPEAIERVKELYPEASYTVAYHAKNDVQHGLDLMIEINRVPEYLHDFVLQSALRTAQLYRDAGWRLLFNLNDGE